LFEPNASARSTRAFGCTACHASAWTRRFHQEVERSARFPRTQYQARSESGIWAVVEGGFATSATKLGCGSQIPSRTLAIVNRNRCAGRVILPMSGDSAAPLIATASESDSRL
jgi:hypothetical protein